MPTQKKAPPPLACADRPARDMPSLASGRGRFCVMSVEKEVKAGNMEDLLLNFVGLAFITELDQLIRTARIAVSGRRTIGPPSKREYPKISAIWLQYSLPLERYWANLKSRASLTSYPGQRRQRGCLMAIIAGFHAVLIFSTSYHHSLWHAAQLWGGADGHTHLALPFLGYLCGWALLHFLWSLPSSVPDTFFGGGLRLCKWFFGVTILLEFLRFASMSEHAQTLGVAEAQCTTDPSFLRRVLCGMFRKGDPYGGCTDFWSIVGGRSWDDACPGFFRRLFWTADGKYGWFSPFVGAVMHSYATSYFVSAPAQPPWQEISLLHPNFSCPVNARR